MYRWPELQFESWNPSQAAYGPLETASVVQLIEALNNDAARERALHLLSKNRANREDLAPLLWYSVGTISILLQEIISVYHSLHSPTLADRVSNRVCDALVLFQCVAANPSTKMPFIEAKLPLYLYPFLNNTNKERPHQFLRVASLGVIGALAKVG
uniref:Cell differentiation protein rcd1 n=1 Tax=Salix viminalis TaxID=40686 RepID=A0A6N2MPB2_SALVM